MDYTDKFMNRHIGPTEAEVAEMLKVIGVASIDELIGQTIPENIRLRQPLDMHQQGMSEYEYLQHIEQIAKRTTPTAHSSVWATTPRQCCPQWCATYSKTHRGTPHTPPIRPRFRRGDWRLCSTSKPWLPASRAWS